VDARGFVPDDDVAEGSLAGQQFTEAFGIPPERPRGPNADVEQDDALARRRRQSRRREGDPAGVLSCACEESHMHGVAAKRGGHLR
jgi:hypothetical protein